MIKTKQDLKLYIAQGKAYQDLLRKTNFHGRYDQKILSIQKQIDKARKMLNDKQ